jgi:tetratricopeptide (TPR) repeat protein
MQLKIKPFHKNNYPLAGVLIEGATVEKWIGEIQLMKLSLSAVDTYAIPGNSANSIWGCLVIFDPVLNKTDIGRNAYCQLINDLLFIPDQSDVYPKFTATELQKLLHGKKHMLHHEFGLVELEEPIDWKMAIRLPTEICRNIKEPAATVFIPKQIRTFQIKPVEIEEVLNAFEEKNFPKRENFKEEPLTPMEKLKLFFYKQLFKKPSGRKETGETSPEQTPFLKQLESIRKRLTKKPDTWINDLQKEFEELAKRNQKHLDRLLNLLDKNPDEALKYAIPLDMNGAQRGSGTAPFDLLKRWYDFSLFRDPINRPAFSGTASLPADAFNQLHSRYLKIAQELIKEKDYKRAAFIYMKLLKNYLLAAQTLEKGGFYQEAASVYLKYCNNKLKAAECFEKGNMIANAIELYKELNQYEKVGDLYTSIQHKEDADFYYQKVVDNFLQHQQYLKAALVCKQKMGNVTAAQELLLAGWKSNNDSFNCLNNYVNNITDKKLLWNELQSIYQNLVIPSNKEIFLQVLKHEFEKKHELAESIKDMAHELIVSHITVNPSVVSDLYHFNSEDKQLITDTIRFKINHKKN